MNHCFLVASLLAGLAHGAVAQGGVRLTKVPELVRLPAAVGSNLLVEAEVDGVASAVWLATDTASRDRVAFTASDAHRWQLNLADARVGPMLPAGRDGGELFVFATVGGATRQSAAIAWSRAEASGGAVRCLVRANQRTTTRAADEAPGWIEAAQLEAIDVQGLGRQGAVVARCGDHEQPLQRRTDGSWRLAADPALRERLLAAETLEIEAKVGTASHLFAFRLVPERLPLPGGKLEFVVPQRQRLPVPGSRGWLVVQIDDITMGGTLLTIDTGDGRALVAARHLHERDFVPFALAGERYVLVVADLVNQLVGDDRADLRIVPADGFVPDRIGQLIRAVGASPALFLRDGKEYPGPVAMQLLVAKAGSHRGEPLTVEAFIDTLASVSSTTGKPYEVRTSTGEVVPMQKWLRATLRDLEAAPAADRK